MRKLDGATTGMRCSDVEARRQALQTELKRLANVFPDSAAMSRAVGERDIAQVRMMARMRADIHARAICGGTKHNRKPTIKADLVSLIVESLMAEGKKAFCLDSAGTGCAKRRRMNGKGPPSLQQMASTSAGDAKAKEEDDDAASDQSDFTIRTESWFSSSASSSSSSEGFDSDDELDGCDELRVQTFTYFVG